MFQILFILLLNLQSFYTHLFAYNSLKDRYEVNDNLKLLFQDPFFLFVVHPHKISMISDVLIFQSYVNVCIFF
jgi:hypothetical protein